MKSESLRPKLTESTLRKIVKESVKKILKEEFSEHGFLYDGNADNDEWAEADITPWDFYIVKDQEVANFHQSPKGFLVYFNDDEFGEVWYERSQRCYRGVSDYDVFNGYKRGFEGVDLNGIIEDMCDKVAEAIIYGNDDDE